MFGIAQHYPLNDAAVAPIPCSFPKAPRSHSIASSSPEASPIALKNSSPTSFHHRLAAAACRVVSTPQLSASKSLFHFSLRASPALQLPLLLPARPFPLHRSCSVPKQKMQKMRAHQTSKRHHRQRGQALSSVTTGPGMSVAATVQWGLQKLPGNCALDLVATVGDSRLGEKQQRWQRGAPAVQNCDQTSLGGGCSSLRGRVAGAVWATSSVFIVLKPSLLIVWLRQQCHSLLIVWLRQQCHRFWRRTGRHKN